MGEILDEALGYLKRGWSVIPLKRDKKPFLDTWKRYQAARPTEGEVRNWWTQWPEANVGIVTGKISGLIVVDADGPDGAASLKTLGSIPPTPSVQTGKGWHYYFAYPGREVRNFARKLPGLDLRGDGGYVMAPPSVHPSGKVYEWAIPPDVGPPGSLPEGVLRLLETAGPNSAPVGEKSPDWVEALLSGVKEGERNAAAARLAGHYLGKGLPPSEVEQMLHLWNRNNKPPLSDQELATVVASVARADAEKRQGAKNFDIAKVEKLTTVPPIYRVHVFDRVVKMNSEDLSSFSRFKRITMQETNRVPAMKRIQEWDGYLDEVLATRLEVVEAPAEASQDAVWWEVVLHYLHTRASEDEAVLAEQHGVLKTEEAYYVHGPSLYRYMQQRQQKIEPRELWDLLRRYKAEDVRRMVRNQQGVTVRVRAWMVPSNSISGFESAEVEPF